jgi:hypothetical protein
MNDQGQLTRLQTGGFSRLWLGLFVPLPMLVFIVGVIMLNWPPISRGFVEGHPLWFNLTMWALANAIAIGLLIYFGRSRHSTVDAVL